MTAQRLRDAARGMREKAGGVTPDDLPTVCIAHGAFIPCRKHGEHRYTDNPYWVKSVRDYQGSAVPGLTWEPAHERTPRPPSSPSAPVRGE